MGTGATTTGVTKTVNLGTGAASGLTTVVNIGSATVAVAVGGTTVVNTRTVTFASVVTQVGKPHANQTAHLLNTLTHHREIVETGKASWRFKHSA